MIHLGFVELRSLLQSSFCLRPQEKDLVFLVDKPGGMAPDNPDWEDRRRIAREWYAELHAHRSELPFSSILFCSYENVGSNNNDLPDTVSVLAEGESEATGPREKTDLNRLLSDSGIVLALTEFSATAPLKILARTFGFRGATMPGFTREMIPALGLDYESVHERVTEIKRRMDRAVSIEIVFRHRGRRDYHAVFDTRFREGHASGGLMRQDGMVANLPSGEAYIVPYEGERRGEQSLTEGLLPVQYGEEVVVYTLKGNRATGVSSAGERSAQEGTRLTEEPAYGNIAEVGIGVLGSWGIRSCGNILLDEKLGLHIAFGRSDHFGGFTAPANFRNKRNVVHIDHVYIPSLQPVLSAESVIFSYGERKEVVMKAGELLV